MTDTKRTNQTDTSTDQRAASTDQSAAAPTDQPSTAPGGTMAEPGMTDSQDMAGETMTTKHQSGR